jgi:hypothetical protein
MTRFSVFLLCSVICSVLTACGGSVPEPFNFSQDQANSIAAAAMKGTRLYFASRAMVGATPATQLNPFTAVNETVDCADPARNLTCTGSYTVSSVGTVGVGYKQHIAYANFDYGGNSYTNPDNTKVVVKTKFNGAIDFLVLRYKSESDYQVSFTYDLVFDQSYIGSGPIQGTATCEQVGFFDVPACQFDFLSFQLKYKYSGGGGFNKIFTMTTNLAGSSGQSTFQYNSWGWNSAGTLGNGSVITMTTADGLTAVVTGSATTSVSVKLSAGGKSADFTSTLQ